MKQKKTNFIFENAENARTEWKHSVRFSLFLFLITILLISLPLVNATKVEAQADYDLIINSWDEHNAKVNKPYTILWDVSNKYGELLPKAATNCTFFMYQSGTFGTFLAGAANRTTVGEAWYKTIPATFLTQNDLYNYQIDCILNANASKSGTYLANIKVSPDGMMDNKAFFYLIIILIYAVAFIGFFGKNPWVTIIGGMGMIPLGLYMINNGIMNFRNSITDVLAWTTIAIGALFSIYAGVEVIKEELG